MNKLAEQMHAVERTLNRVGETSTALLELSQECISALEHATQENQAMLDEMSIRQERDVQQLATRQHNERMVILRECRNNMDECAAALRKKLVAMGIQQSNGMDEAFAISPQADMPKQGTFVETTPAWPSFKPPAMGAPGSGDHVSGDPEEKARLARTFSETQDAADMKAEPE